jgi:hypothetical protein
MIRSEEFLNDQKGTVEKDSRSFEPKIIALIRRMYIYRKWSCPAVLAQIPRPVRHIEG